MSIDIQLYFVPGVYGTPVAVEAKAVILHSPSEGFDSEKLGELEKDLGMLITKRLNLAIKKKESEVAK